MVQIDAQYRPQVLLLGNGLNRTYGGNSWGGLLQKIAVRSDLPKELHCPYPLQAVLVTNDHVKTAMKDHKDEFYGTVSDRLSKKLQVLLETGFDDILTTNYSYELEATALEKTIVSDHFLKKTCGNIREGERAEGKYLISTCQNVNYHKTPNRIWHIHGEARKPDSMILGHYYYATLLHKMTEYVQGRKNVFQENQRESNPQTIGSWLDSFILGDVYMLGFGMEFSEIDLWWLLNRKKRENADHGKVYFYTPGGEKFSEKEELLKLLEVNVVHCDCKTPEGTDDEKNALYDLFYQKAIADILQKVNTSK